MKNSKHHHNKSGRPSTDSTIEAHRPRWRRIHHDWRFWVFLVLMVTAMVIYIASEDLSVHRVVSGASLSQKMSRHSINHDAHHP